MTELAVLQTVRLKGRIAPAGFTVTLDAEPAEVDGTVTRLVDAGLLVGDTTLRLSSEGRARLAELLTAERRDVDRAAITAAYTDFRDVNTEFKAAVTDWQVRAGEPNTHDDADYDAAILGRVEAVHQRVLPVLTVAAAQLPRLSGYAGKLQRALDKVKAGHTAWLTRPLVDSYHTVWFELHEELIAAAGLTRAEEAKSGHAD